MIFGLPVFLLHNFWSSFPLIWLPEGEHAICLPPQSSSCLELSILELVVMILRVLIISLYNFQFVCWLLGVNWMAVFANISTETDSHVIFIYTLSSKWLFSLEWYSYTIYQHSIVGRRGKPICREEWSCCLTICLCLVFFLFRRKEWLG